MTMTADLIQAPDGPISCSLCGAGPLDGTQPHPCPVEAARRLLGGAPPALAARLYQAAGDASTARAVAADLRAVAEGVEALAGRAPGPLRVYVAGGAGERAACGLWVRRLQAEGVEVTHDWTVDPGWDDPAPSPAMLAAAAMGDLDGVRRCDVLWLLCPMAKSEGSAAELGAALAWGRRVIVSGPWDSLGRIFPGLAGECYRHHEEGFRGVVRAAAGRVLLAGGRVSA